MYETLYGYITRGGTLPLLYWVKENLKGSLFDNIIKIQLYWIKSVKTLSVNEVVHHFII